MALYSKKTLVAVKKETVYGTDPVPAGVDCYLVKNASLTPLAGDSASRDLIRPYFGNSETIQVNQHAELTFEVEYQSSGTPGTAPGFAPALLGCALDETIAAGVSAAYQPVSAGFDSNTVLFFMDGVLQKLTGARGSVSLNLAKGALPSLSFKYTGLYNAPTDTAPLTPDFSRFKTPLGANCVNTPTVLLHGEALVMESLSIDLANNLVHRCLPGGTGEVLITDRKPSGSIVFEATTVAAKAWVEAARTTASGALQVVHGITAGYICQIDAPHVTLGAPTYSDSDGISMLNIPLTFTPGSAGNDELVFTFK